LKMLVVTSSRNTL